MQRHDRRLRGSVGGLGHQSRQTAMFLAAATVPRTFQRSLMPRSNLDQGLITGIATVANYALASVLHDVIAEAGIRVARRIRREGYPGTPGNSGGEFVGDTTRQCGATRCAAAGT